MSALIFSFSSAATDSLNSSSALVVSATIFMVAGALPAGAATVQLFSEKAVDNTPLVTFVGAIWFLVMAAAVLFGVEFTAKAQWIMSSIEVGLLVVFGVQEGEVAGVTTVHAPGVGDDEVVAQCRDHTASGDAVTVASADRALLSRLDPLGVTTLGPRALRAELARQR